MALPQPVFGQVLPKDRGDGDLPGPARDFGSMIPSTTSHDRCTRITLYPRLRSSHWSAASFGPPQPAIERACPKAPVALWEGGDQLAGLGGGSDPFPPAPYRWEFETGGGFTPSLARR